MQLDPYIYIFITLKDSCSVYNFCQIFCFEHAILKYRQNLGTRFKLVRVWIASLHPPNPPKFLPSNYIGDEPLELTG